MTKREFNQKVEDITAWFERGIKTEADDLERGITGKYNKSHLLHFTTRGIFTVAEIGLLTGAKHLARRGRRTAAMRCAGLEGTGLVTELLPILIFRRKK